MPRRNGNVTAPRREPQHSQAEALAADLARLWARTQRLERERAEALATQKRVESLRARYSTN